MKIKFANIVLNENSELPKDITIQTRRLVQTEFPIESDTAKIFDRKNLRMNISFIIERSHRDEDSARIFAFEHSINLSELSPAILEFIDESKGLNTQFKSAMPIKIKSENNALITSTKYEFIAEKLERSTL